MEWQYRMIADNCRWRAAEACKRADQWARELTDLAKQARAAGKARQKALDEAQANDSLERDINRRIDLAVEERSVPRRRRKATECERRELAHREAKKRQKAEARAARQERGRANQPREEQLGAEPESHPPPSQGGEPNEVEVSAEEDSESEEADAPGLTESEVGSEERDGEAGEAASTQAGAGQVLAANQATEWRQRRAPGPNGGPMNADWEGWDTVASSTDRGSETQGGWRAWRGGKNESGSRRRRPWRKLKSRRRWLQQQPRRLERWLRQQPRRLERKKQGGSRRPRRRAWLTRQRGWRLDARWEATETRGLREVPLGA